MSMVLQSFMGDSNADSKYNKKIVFKTYFYFYLCVCDYAVCVYVTFMWVLMEAMKVN